MTQQPINRCLADKAMDRIDHALGRPLNPMAETYRNFYSTSGAEADTMASSPHWIEGRPGSFRCFAVTDEGRAALAAHLREIADPHRAYAVTFAGHERMVIAGSASKARYSHFLDLSDCIPDLSFKDFCRRTTVRATR